MGRRRGPTQEGRLAQWLGKGPRPHKLAGLCVACECPHGPHLLGHSPGARTGPLLAPEPGGWAPPGLDLGRGTLHSQLCRHRSCDLEQVSHPLGDPAVDGSAPLGMPAWLPPRSGDFPVFSPGVPGWATASSSPPPGPPCPGGGDLQHAGPGCQGLCPLMRPSPAQAGC